jgi:hypothetical protein
MRILRSIRMTKRRLFNAPTKAAAKKKAPAKKAPSPMMNFSPLQPLTDSKSPVEIRGRNIGDAHLIQYELITSAMEKSGINYFSMQKAGRKVLGVLREDFVAKFDSFAKEAPGLFANSKKDKALANLETLSEVSLYFRLNFSESNIELGPRFAVKVEIWSKGEFGFLDFSGSGGGFSKLPIGIDELGDGADFKHLSKLNSFIEQIDAPLDVVIMWVDGSDADWNKKKNDALTRLDPGNNVLPNHFRDNGELSVAVESILQFMPWIRNLFIVTDAQNPNLNGIKSEKIKVIDHQDFIPDYAVLPTFNSHVIGAFLHRIPGISKHFIATNDDIFALRVIEKEAFLTRNGIIKINSTASGISHHGVPTNSNPESARANAHLKMSEHFDKPIYPFRLKHVPVVIDRDAMCYLEESYKQEFSKLASNQFRNESDFDPVYLHAFFLHESGRALLVNSIKYEYLGTHSENLSKNVENLLARNLDFLCLNDTLSETDSNFHSEISKALKLLSLGSNCGD